MPFKHNGIDYYSKKELDGMVQKRLSKLQVENQRLREKLKEVQPPSKKK